MKKNIVIVVLSLLVLGLTCFIVYDKFINKDEKETEVNEQESNTSEGKMENNSKTDRCVGIYNGHIEAPHSPGDYTVELKSDDTYLVNGINMGEYKIVDDLLLLKEHSDACGPGETCYPSYVVNFLDDDCSTIQWLYGTDRFSLTKQN